MDKDSALSDDCCLASTDALTRAMSRAHIQYRHIRRHTADPEVHIPYLEALLSIGTSRYLATAVYRLCDALHTHRKWHPRLIQVLGRVLLEFGR